MIEKRCPFKKITMEDALRDSSYHFITCGQLMIHMIALAGDLHGAIDAMVAKTKDADIVLQAGDFGTFLSRDKMDRASRMRPLGDFPDYLSGRKSLPAPVYFIKGNHEDFDMIERIRDGIIPNLHYLDNGRCYVFEGRRIGTLGGNFSSVRYHLDRGHVKLSQGRRRHYNHQDVEELLMNGPYDVILAHEGPKGTGLRGRDGEDIGIQVMNDVIEELSPALFVHGHYHRYQKSMIAKTEVISLDRITGSSISVIYI
jgi:Icc-related predicted phosphoesterase